jgi:fructosamine-3-kinase
MVTTQSFVGRGAATSVAEAAPGVGEAERVGERVNGDVVAGQGPTEAPPWRTMVRWIVLHPDRDAVLVIDGGALPSAELSSAVWLGDAPALTGALAELGVDAVLLGCCDLRDDPQTRVQHLTMMALPRPGSVDAPPGTRWVEHEEVGEVRTGRPAWEARSWFPATDAWLRDQLARLGRPVIGRTEQQRSWELSSVLRAPTAAGPVWLKASAGSSLFAEEGGVMALLADWFPEQVPPPLAWDPARRLLVLDELGPPLGHHAAIEVQEQVLVDFARLQAVTAERLDGLWAVGLADRAPDRLADQAAGWFSDLDATLELPGLDPQTWLTAEESMVLRAALPRVLTLCRELAAGPLPLTLLHGDLHMNNVAAGPRRPVFFDWTDACVGHPFFDLITVAHGAIPLPGASSNESRTRLRDAYLSAWTDYGSPEQLKEIWRAVEVVGPLHHAVSYRAIAAACAAPVDQEMGPATAGWLRSVITALQT